MCAAAPDAPPRTLVVVDGTWTTARKMLARSPILRALPRVSLRPAAPSTYRIRREPAAHCLSTVEAVVAALTMLEGDGARFAPLLAAFDRLVTTQLEHMGRHPVPFRHERKHRRPRRASAVEAALADAERVVVVQAEGNPRDGALHELVHLVALRPRAARASPSSSGLVSSPRARRHGWSALIARRRCPAGGLASAWSAFVRPGDALVGWGHFTPTLLAANGLGACRGSTSAARSHGGSVEGRAAPAACAHSPPPAAA